MTKKIGIIGGGLSGSLLAIFMAKRGHKVTLFERRPDMRNTKIPAGKSINLALSNRGIHALEKVGLADEIMQDAIPMYGRMMHGIDGKLNYQPYGKYGQAINSVSRGRLNIKLLELCGQYENIDIVFNARCTDIQFDNMTAFFEMENAQKMQFEADHFFGTDGAFAATRARMQTTDRFNYWQNYLHVGYKELAIPSIDEGGFRMEKHALHIWPRGAFMMIALPNPAGDFTCTLFLPFDGENSFKNLQSDKSVLSFFEKQFPDAIPMMPTLLEDFRSNPTSSLVTVRCFPWVMGDKLAMAGDAAHAVVPFFGQGMNCSFEDVVVLDACIEAQNDNWVKAFDDYQLLRKPNADAISQLAIDNYTEMAEKVGDAHFLHKKRIEHQLTELYPDNFRSQYELVTFSLEPYEYARQQGIKNDKLLEKIIADNAESRINDSEYMSGLWDIIK